MGGVQRSLAWSSATPHAVVAVRYQNRYNFRRVDSIEATMARARSNEALNRLGENYIDFGTPRQRLHGGWQTTRPDFSAPRPSQSTSRHGPKPQPWPSTWSPGPCTLVVGHAIRAMSVGIWLGSAVICSADVNTSAVADSCMNGLFTAMRRTPCTYCNPVQASMLSSMVSLVVYGSLHGQPHN